MGSRSKARRRALDILFEAEQRGLPIVEMIRARVQDPGTHQSPVPVYAVTAATGVAEYLDRIDEILETYSQGWTVARMPAVDRSILRLGVWEILWNSDVPDAVAVDEAVALAVAMSTDESPAFVNALLQRVMDLKPMLAS